MPVAVPFRAGSVNDTSAPVMSQANGSAEVLFLARIRYSMVAPY